MTSQEKSITHKLAEAANHTVVYVFASLAQSATSFLLVPLYAHYFSPSDYGTLALLGMIGSIGAAIFYLGINSALPVTYFEFKTQHERDSVVRTALSLTIAGATLQIILGFTCQKFLSMLVLESTKYQSLIPLVIGSSSIGFVNQIFLNLLRMQRRSATVAVTGAIGAVFAVGLTFVLITRFGLGISSSLWASFISQLALLAAYWFMTRDNLRGTFIRSEALKMLKFGAPTVLISFAVMTVEWSDRILIQKLLSPTDVGTYSFGFRLGAMISPLIIAPFVQIINPMLMEYRNDKNHASFSGSLFSVYYLTAAILIFITSLFIDDFFNLFVRNPEYWAAKSIVIWIMAGCLAYGTNNIFSVGLIYQRRLKPVVALSYAGAVINLALNVWLIPVWGIRGAAVTYVVINFANPAATYLIARKYFPIPFEIRRLGLITLVWGSAILIPSMIPWPPGHIGFVARIIFGALVLFFGVISAIKPEERRKITDMIEKKIANLIGR